MAFDFEKLMDDPSFQMGLAVLGGSSPNRSGLMNAYQVIQNRKKMELEKQQQAQQMELERARSDLYRQQIEATKAGLEQKQKEMQQRQENLRNLPRLLQQLQGGGLAMGGQGSVTGSPMANTQTPQAQPGLALPPMPEPTGKYGTPLKHLNSLMQIESSGNARAMGPLLPEGDRAMGAFQFRPSTINMLKKDGIVFDPFNIEQSRDAADYYIQKLVKEHGGDYAKAYAAYGGFKSKDPTKYVTGIMGSPEKQAAQIAQAQAQTQQQQRSQQFAATYDTGVNVDLDTGDIKLDIKPSYRRAEMEATERRHQDTLRQQQEAARLAAEKDRRDAERDRLAAEKAAQDLAKPGQEKAQGLQRFNTIIKDLRKSYDTLQTGGDIVDPSKGTMENLGAGMASSVPGQAIGKVVGTKAQSERNKIAMARPLLMLAIMQATGMSAKQLDSEKELKLYLDTATDPSLDIEANRAGLARLQELFGGGSTGTIRVRSPDGKTGTIPASQLQEALKAGYQQVQ